MDGLEMCTEKGVGSRYTRPETSNDMSYKDYNLQAIRHEELSKQRFKTPDGDSTCAIPATTKDTVVQWINISDDLIDPPDFDDDGFEVVRAPEPRSKLFISTNQGASMVDVSDKVGPRGELDLFSYFDSVRHYATPILLSFYWRYFSDDDFNWVSNPREISVWIANPFLFQGLSRSPMNQESPFCRLDHPSRMPIREEDINVMYHEESSYMAIRHDELSHEPFVDLHGKEPVPTFVIPSTAKSTIVQCMNSYNYHIPGHPTNPPHTWKILVWSSIDYTSRMDYTRMLRKTGSIDDTSHMDIYEKPRQSGWLDLVDYFKHVNQGGDPVRVTVCWMPLDADGGDGPVEISFWIAAPAQTTP